MKVPQLIRDKAREIDFPSMYAHALDYLQQCAAVDEVKEFSDKVAAAAAYYKQKNDRNAVLWLKRIQLRSAAGLGELLKSIPLGTATDSEIRGEQACVKLRAGAAASTIEEMADAMDEATDPDMQKLLAIPLRDRREAVAIANLPEVERDKHIESDRPPSVKMLAALSDRMRQPARPEPTEAEKSAQKRRLNRHYLIHGIQQILDVADEYNSKAAFNMLHEREPTGTPYAVTPPTCLEIDRVIGYLQDVRKIYRKPAKE